MMFNPVLRWVFDLKKLPNSKEMELDFRGFVERNGSETDKIKLLSLKTNQLGSFVLFKYRAPYECFVEREPDEKGQIWFPIWASAEEFWNYENGFFRECRSLVLDVAKLAVVNQPFKKFFNIGELAETSIDVVEKQIANASIVEISNKLDGSIINASWYDEQLVVSTTSILDENIPENGWFLREARAILEQEPYLSMIKRDKNFTFSFEYVTKNMPHTVQYDEDKMVLIGMRHKIDGFQLSYKDIKWQGEVFNIPTPQIFAGSLEEALEQCKTAKGTELEGFVLRIYFTKTKECFMYKTKAEDYLALSRVIEYLSPNAVIRAIADNKYDDMYAQLPEIHKPKVDEMAQKVLSYISAMENAVTRCFQTYFVHDRAGAYKPNWYYVEDEELTHCTSIGHTMRKINVEVPKFLRGWVISKYRNNVKQFGIKFIHPREQQYLLMKEIEEGLEKLKNEVW